ncbi:Invasin beta-domain of outer membrane [Enterobacter sp. CC120223-11]|nr:Invasin beta-domain of outer membrane [Enterobacter sp. CC120223-11]
MQSLNNSEASQTDSFFSGRSGSNEVGHFASSTISGVANRNVQQWLGLLGTARVNVDIDEKFSLKNTHAELLVPLYENQEWLAFTQGALYHADSRTQSSLGLGARYIRPHDLAGANLFLDHDYSNDHTRMGMGVEYWRDFLKLSGNGYFRLTNWKDSSGLSGYESRPANGWDIRAQGWVPAYPKLGGKLSVEQYYGDEVALFGKNKRQRDPYAMTAGVNYTPIPLLTFNMDQRQGKSGTNDTRFGLEINYDLAMSWQNHFESDAVRSLRHLVRSRYDMVERNNNMVLEYRKKEDIQLSTANVITGYSGERKSLQVRITSQHGVAHIDWSGPEFIAAGGKIVRENDGEYSVVLPSWQQTSGSVNSWKVRGTAIDKKGNTSMPTETVVSVLGTAIKKSLSTFTPDNIVLPADGKSFQTLVLTVKDEKGLPVNVADSEVAFNISGAKEASSFTMKKKHPGIYEVTIKSGLKTGDYTITPTIGGVELSSARISIVEPNNPVVTNSSIATNKSNYYYGEDIHVTVALRDAANKVITGKSALLATSVSQLRNVVQKGNWTDNGDGTYSIIYVAQNLGYGLRMDLTLTGTTGKVQSAPFNIVAGPAREGNSTLSIDRTSYRLGENILVTVKLKDARNNPVSGETDWLSRSLSVPNSKQKGNWIDHNNGTYTIIYEASKTGGAIASLYLGGWYERKNRVRFTVHP